MEAVTDLILPVVWVVVIFLPGFVLNYFLPRIGLIVGVVIMTIALWLGGQLPIWILFINLVGVVIILFRGNTTSGVSA